jgi:hypothetical protein
MTERELRDEHDQLLERHKVLADRRDDLRRDIDFPHTLKSRLIKYDEMIAETEEKLSTLKKERSWITERLQINLMTDRLYSVYDELESVKLRRSAIIKRLEQLGVEREVSQTETEKEKFKKLASKFTQEELQDLLGSLVHKFQKVD